jgi:hypothetical protein
MTKEQVGFLEFARLVLDALAAADVEYLIGGAVALWAWGEVRTTQDFDLVVNLPIERIASLSEELKRRNMLVPPDVIVDLLLQPEGDLPINAIHMDSGYKAELFLLRPGDVFRETALARRRLVDLGPPLGQVYVHAPEDLILNKIHYYSLSYQSKHVRDIAGIIVESHDLIDMDYIDRWANSLGLADPWQEMQRQIADILRGDDSL